MAEKTRLAAVEELKQKRTIMFSYRQEGIAREGFLVCHHGEVFAYENVCRHIPISLDYGDGRFLTPDGRHIRCQTHGALYEPGTGLCVEGPCPGAYLKKLPIEVSGGDVFLLESLLP